MTHDALAWTLLAVLTLAGVAGVFVPLLPGPILILAAAGIHKWMLPEVLSWWTVGMLASLVLLDMLASALGSLLGARMAGASRWGMVGAGIGALAGIFYGLPGLLAGTLAGAMLAEVFVASRPPEEAARAAAGAAIGVVLSGLARFGIALTMVALLLADAFLW